MNPDWQKVDFVKTTGGASISLVMRNSGQQKETRTPVDIEEDVENNYETTGLFAGKIRYEDGTIIRNGILVEPPADEAWWVGGSPHTFRSYPLAATALFERIEDSLNFQSQENYPVTLKNFRISRNRRDVPVNILNEGKSVVTAYLYIIHGWSKDEVAEMLELSPETVQQYLTNVRAGIR